jgi:type I restriction enzyme S subunit
MMSRERNIPQLRFPDFTEDWDNSTLGKLLTFKNGLNAEKEDYGDGEKFINVLDIIQNNYITYDKIIGSVKTSDKNKELYKVEYGDILFQRSSETREEVGQANVYLDKEKPALFGGFVIRGKKNGTYDPIFLNHLLKTPVSRQEITSKSGGSTRYNVGQETLSSVSVTIASLPEQQKIASFLSSVDERIELLEQKKEKLEAYKKGVMQQIFTQKIRFKQDDGSEFPDWEEKKLGEIGSTYGGLSGKNKEDFGTGKPYIQYMQIFSNSKVDPRNFGLVEISENEKQNSAKVGDVFFTISSETPDEIGTASVLVEDVGEVYLNSFCFGFRPNSLEELDPNFSRYLFRSPEVRRKIVTLAQGSTRYNMSKTELLKQAIVIPCGQEQKKIASFLGALDENLETLDSQIQGLRTWKKGLLQQMFV